MSFENTQSSTNKNPVKHEDNLDLGAVINQVSIYWWLFLLFVIISLSAAFLYLRYSTAEYKVAAKILVKDDKKGGNTTNGSQMFAEMGLLGGQNSVDNEVELLKSRTVMENTVAALQLNLRYFTLGKVKQSEMFAGKLPFVLAINNVVEDSLQPNAILTFQAISNQTFNLTYNNVQKAFSYGDTLSFPFGKLVFFNKKLLNLKFETPINIIINQLSTAVADFQKKLNVAVTSKTVSTIDLTFEDPIPARGELLLNNLIRIYNKMNTEDKNRVADSTITFIDNRLIFVTRELGDVEKNIEQFRQHNQLTDMSAQGKLLLENSSDYFKELSKTEVQISIIHSLENYLQNEQNTSRTIPAGLVIEDPTFASMIEKYNTLQLEKERQLQSTTESNPIVQRLIVQIATLKADIIANLATIKRSMEITSAQLKSRTSSFQNEIQQVPRKERAFLEISRQQAIKQELYLYLLKKREETAVSKAANIDNARIVDNAKSELSPFSPKRNLIYLLALLLGILFPGLILYARSLLNTKVKTKSDITRITSAAIVGEIGRSPNHNNLIVRENPRHPVAEQLRLLRTNLNFILPANSGCKVIMLTSSMSGEGKSFLSLNFAAMLALGGKKVALLEFDLRKPKLSKYLGLNNNEGITSFLVKLTPDISKLGKIVTGTESLFFVGSGAIPPNPAELINSDQTTTLFHQLRDNFDFVILDVPPVGVVTDALLLSKYTDITLYVIRQGYTFKNQVELLDELYVQEKLPKLGIVLNDVKRQKGYGYGYSYGYGYGYTDE